MDANFARWASFVSGGMAAAAMLAGAAQAQAQGITRPLIQTDGWSMIEHLPAAG